VSEEKHLSGEQIDRLVEVLEGRVDRVSDGLLNETRHHLATCATCQKLVVMYQESGRALARLCSGEPGGRTAECPPEQFVIEVAGGIASKHAATVLSHVSRCSHCGRLLKMAVETFGTNKDVEETKVLASLASSTEEWQRKLGHRLAAASAPLGKRTAPLPAASNLGRLWGTYQKAWLYAAASAVLLGATAFGWIEWHSRARYADQLLAEAYTERRNIEPRIAGAKHAPVRGERGAGTSSLEKPASLLKAETLIVEHLRKNPSDPKWLAAEGRAELLDGEYESAIKSLRRALDVGQDSQSVLTDLGSAYLLRAEEAGRPADYGKAIESLTESLAKSSDDPIAIFNRGLALERMFLYSEAIEDWEHYLHVDPSGDWAREAQANLQRVKKAMAERDRRSATPLLTPKAFAEAIETNHDSAIALLDGRVEQYLETATASWLLTGYAEKTAPDSRGSEARRALQYLAEILTRNHDDSWLSEFLASSAVGENREGLNLLAASDRALHDGRYGLSSQLAKESKEAFERSRSRPGILRASFAEMLAESFEIKYRECQRRRDAILPQLFRTHYRWLQVQTLLQGSECQDALGMEENAIENASSAFALARRFHYPGLALRTVAFQAAYQRDLETGDQAMHDLRDGLETFWQNDVSNTRGENLYSALFDLAGTKNWHHLEASAIAEKIADFPDDDPMDRAASWELLAGAQQRAGDYAGAQRSLRKATDQLPNVPEDRGLGLRKAEISLEDAEILLSLGNSKEAFSLLSGVHEEFERADEGVFQAEYFKTYGEVYVSLGMVEDAEPLVKRALIITEGNLRRLGSEADKLQWSRLEGEVYRDLVEIKLKSGTAEEAFALWEWYKSASIHSGQVGDFAQLTAVDETVLSLPNDPQAAQTATISYFVRKTGITVFIVRDGIIRTRFLPVASEAKIGGLHLISLCGDPSSSIDAVYAESRRLYDILVAPIEVDVQGKTRLKVETDGILDNIPFDLLMGIDRRFLSERFEMSYSPGIMYARRSPLGLVSSSSVALVVLASGTEKQSPTGPLEASEEGEDVSSYFRKVISLRGPDVSRVNILRNLPDAEVFHFVGHAVADRDRVGLLVGREMVMNSSDVAAMRPERLKLAVLSACNTANGDEGSAADANSLARTLVVAGVPQTVASRWKVDSAMTRELMRAFYANVMTGKTPAESLRSASTRIRGLPGYTHPYYWASFAVFGS
jgi:CHAT domain-containing protein/tetratricopeptide (TPR) repeat protein